MQFFNSQGLGKCVFTKSANYTTPCQLLKKKGIAQWATRIAGTGNDNISFITSDSSGNIYMTGYYASNPLTIYNADGSTFGTLANAGSDDICVVKYNPAGTAQWATRLAGTGSDQGFGITSDSPGNSYTVGTYTSNPLTIYNADGSTFGTLPYSGSGGDICVVKYNTAGTAQWVTRLAGSLNDQGYRITSDSSGNIYVTGPYASNPLTIYNADGSTFGTLANAGSDDIYVVKYNATTGTAQWATRLAGSLSDQGYRITSDSSGNIYVTGPYASNPLTIYNADGSTFGTLGNAGSNDVYVVKYNPAGTAQWATRLTGTGNDQGFGITSDSSGNIYVTGTYTSNPLTIYNSDSSTFGTLTNSGSNDIFIVKISN